MNGRLGWIESESSSGLPSGRFLIPATNPYTPFSNSTYLAVSDRTRPLRSNSDTTNRSLSTTLNANFAMWHGTLAARYDERERNFESQTSGSLAGGLGTVDNATNPFDGSLAARIPINTRLGRSRTSTSQINGDVDGPLFDLWAGPLLVRAGIGAAWVRFNSSDSFGERSLRRHEYTAKGGVTVPLTSTSAPFLPTLGDSEIALDIGRTELGRYGALDRHSIAFNWQPLAWLRLAASDSHEEQPVILELVAAPEVTTPNVPYFDPLTGETVEVTTISGGAGGLEPAKLRTQTLSVTANPLAKYNLQLNADFVITDFDNQIGALPPPSSAVVAAFPDRFQRDSSGTLVLVDNRSVNFAGQHTEHLRLGVGFVIPLSAAVTVRADPERGTAARRIPPTRLQVNVSHTYLFKNTTVIRDGLPEIDLLDGGAIGIGGGRQRHSTDANVALTRGNSGIRASLRQRGASYLVIGTAASPDLLTFEPITTLDLKAFVDLSQFRPNDRLAKGTRLTVAFENLLNERQTVRNSLGQVPQAYQPARRDPIGRTIMIELRKVF